MYLFSHLATTIHLSMNPLKNKENYLLESYQLLLVMKGSLSVEFQGEKHIMKQNDLILLHPTIVYDFEPITDNTLLQLTLPIHLIQSILGNEHDIVCNSSIGRRNDYAPLIGILTDMVVYYNKEAHHLKMCTLLYSLLDCLNEKFLVEKKSTTIVGQNPYITERIHKITSYIQINYPMPLNLQTLADHMFLTPQYLSKFIKQNFGLNFNNYLNKVRMEHALVELEETTHSIISIAFNNGFASTTSFNKLFKEMYNVPPSTYRNAIQKEPQRHMHEMAPASIPESIVPLMSDSTGFSQTPKSNSHRYVIDMTKKQEISPPWLKIINLGFAQNILSHNFREIFVDCQAKMNFSYARVENILSDKIFMYIPKTNTYNFTVYDDIMNFLMRCRVYPLIELGNKPEKILFSPENFEQNLPLIDTALDKANALDALLKHSINRYGAEYVSHWKFELWCPQDDNLNPLITPAQYAKLYLAYSKVLHKYLPDTNIGAPGFNTSGNLENFVQILKELKKEKIVPDFISIYLFSYEPGSYDENTDILAFRILSLDPSRFKRVVSQIKETLAHLFSEPLPIYVTVFNSNILPEIFVANSAFQAAFICKNALDLLPDVAALGYWIFTDISNEYALTQPQAISGIGLLDTYGIKKPSYFAFEFLSRLGNNLIEQGPNCCVTSSYDNKYQILAYNYAHFNKYFCINCRERIEFQDTYSIFEQGETLNMQVDLTHLPPGRYKIRKHILNRSNGSFLDEFIKILELGNSTPEELLYMMLNMQISEVDYYKSISIPRQEISYANCEDHLVLNLSMEPHEVNYFSISRKL